MQLRLPPSQMNRRDFLAASLGGVLLTEALGKRYKQSSSFENSNVFLSLQEGLGDSPTGIIAKNAQGKQLGELDLTDFDSGKYEANKTRWYKPLQTWVAGIRANNQGQHTNLVHDSQIDLPKTSFPGKEALLNALHSLGVKEKEAVLK